MTQLTERPIAIFDLDGVVIRNPESALSGPPITSHTYWEHHWTNPDHSLIQSEVVTMMHALQGMGYHIMVLTARPIFFEPQTIALLEHCKFGVVPFHQVEGNVGFNAAFAPTEFVGRNVTLLMYDGSVIPSGSGRWKANVIKTMIDAGLNVQFMVEDYKQNADAIRKHVPVLLYERKK